MPFFDIFASPRWSPLRMRTKVASFFIFFQELSNKKQIKALRPKMTKIASRGGGGGPALTELTHHSQRKGRFGSLLPRSNQRIPHSAFVHLIALQRRNWIQAGVLHWERLQCISNHSTPAVRKHTISRCSAIECDRGIAQYNEAASIARVDVCPEPVSCGHQYVGTRYAVSW